MKLSNDNMQLCEICGKARGGPNHRECAKVRQANFNGSALRKRQRKLPKMDPTFIKHMSEVD